MTKGVSRSLSFLPRSDVRGVDAKNVALSFLAQRAHDATALAVRGGRVN